MTVNLTYPGVSQLSVENFGSGSINVQPGSDPGQVEGSLDAGDRSLLDAVVVRLDLGHLRISLPQRRFGSSSAQLNLSVPPGLSYNLATGSASVTMSADIARSRITSGSGDISLGLAADVTCTTGSGDVSIGRVHGEAVRVHTGSGDIRIDDARCPVSAKSGSGDVLIGVLHHADLQASSGSGDISVPSTTGSVDLRSASGSLAVGIADDLPAWLDLDSVSGSIHISLQASAEPEPGEPYVSIRARTASGEIAVFRA